MSGMPEMEFGHQKEASGSKVCEKETSGTFNTCCGKWTCFLMGGVWLVMVNFTCQLPLLQSYSYIISGCVCM